MKIDLVYLWVDGNEPQWRAKKNAELAKKGELPVEAVGDYRYNDNDELLMSLRSVEKFAPWINRIFIVTDNQIPKWLNAAHPKITVVDHTEIMPADALPCFNPVVIEFFIPNIPALSEHFLYANDDMLMMATTKPTYFFTNDGTPIIRVNDCSSVKKQMRNLFPAGEKFKTAWDNASIYVATKLNSMKMVYELAGNYDYGWQEAHNIDPYRKSDMMNLINMPPVKEILERMRKNRFRDRSDMQRILFHLYGVAKLGYQKIGRSFSTQMAQYVTFRFRDIPTYTDDVKKKMRRTIRRKLICIQDTRDGRYRTSNYNFLTNMFPKKSEFEK